MTKPRFSILDHRVAGWYFPWIMQGNTPTPSPLEKKVRLMKEVGYDGVGTAWWDLVAFYQEQGDLSQLKAVSDQLNFPWTAYTFMPEGWAFGKGDQKKNALSLAKSSLDLAHAAGCQGPTLVGPFDSGNLREAATAFREIYDYAEQLGMTLALEFMGPSPRINSVNVAWEVVELAGGKNTGIAIDTYHFFAGPSTLKDLEALPLEKILGVHLADGPADLSDPSLDFNRKMPGQGELPLVELVQILAQKGFNNYWHVECIHGGDYASDLRTVAQRALHSTRKVVEKGLSESSAGTKI